MRLLLLLLFFLLLAWLLQSCLSPPKERKAPTAADLLGNPAYPAISYGGYREKSRDIQPSIGQLKEDMQLLSAMGIRVIRTYNVHRPHAANVLAAIRELKEEKPSFEMYVMLGVWIDCKNAWTDQQPIHDQESERNAKEIEEAVRLATAYEDIVKIVAVGNEAMVKWAAAYYVEPDIILKWVKQLQMLKQDGQLPADLWITSSDNFASWGGGEELYQVAALRELIRAVDYISLHTYPMHDTHYNPAFWGTLEEEEDLADTLKIQAAMLRSRDYAQQQYQSVVAYVRSLGLDKPVHIGETGWATQSNEFYGAEGSKAVDEYKSALFYRYMREWTQKDSISCFYFEAFDEQWKDAANPLGSENHFGLINLQGQAKYALWDLVDQGVFEGLSRDGRPITKTFNGQLDSLLQTVVLPPKKQMQPATE